MKIMTTTMKTTKTNMTKTNTTKTNTTMTNTTKTNTTRQEGYWLIPPTQSQIYADVDDNKVKDKD